MSDSESGETLWGLQRAVVIGAATYLVVGVAGLVGYRLLGDQGGFVDAIEAEPYLFFGGGMIGAVAGSILTVRLSSGGWREKIRNAIYADVLSSVVFYYVVVPVGTILASAVLPAMGDGTPSIVMLIWQLPGVLSFGLLYAVPVAIVSLVYTTFFGALTIGFERAWRHRSAGL